MAATAGLTFRLFGEDVSASDALNNIGVTGKKIAAGLAAAFAAAGIKDAIEQNFSNDAVLAKFKAGLGTTPAAAKEAGDIAGQLWRNGFGDSLEDTTDAVAAVGAQLLALDDAPLESIKTISAQAMSLATVMGVDVTDVTRAAGNMLKNGLAPDAQTAFDVIATGAQNGANNAGDLLDTLTEYGDSFSNIGLSGQDALTMMTQAMSSGAFTTDIAADSVREFATRVLDGSADAAGAFTSLGLDAAGMTAAVAGGGPAARTAFTQILAALKSTTDPLKREQAGVALFGSMWEDAGAQMVLAMDPAAEVIGDVSGAAQKMGDTLMNNDQTKVEVARRGFQSLMQSITQLPGPMGDVAAQVMGIGAEALPMASALGLVVIALKDVGVFAKLAAAGQWLLNLAMSANPIMLIVAAVAALVGGFIWLWTTSEGFRNFWVGLWETAKTAVTDAVEWFITKWNALTASFGFILTAISTQWQQIWTSAQTFFGGIAQWFVDRWNGIRDTITGILSGILGTIQGWAANVQQTASDIRDWFVDRWMSIYSFFASIWNAISNVASNVGRGISTVISTVANWIRDRIDDIVNFVTAIPRRISDAIQDIKDQLSGAAGSLFTLQTPRGILDGVSWFAEGGIVTRPTLAIVGEAGPEMITPLTRGGTRGGFGGGGVGGTDIYVTVHGFVGNEVQLAGAIQDAFATARRRGAIVGTV